MVADQDGRPFLLHELMALIETHAERCQDPQD